MTAFRPLLLLLAVAASVLSFEASANERRTCRAGVSISNLLGQVCGLGGGGNNPLLYRNPNTVCDLGSVRLPGLPDFSLGIPDLNTCRIVQRLGNNFLNDLDRAVDQSPNPQPPNQEEIQREFDRLTQLYGNPTSGCNSDGTVREETTPRGLPRPGAIDLPCTNDNPTPPINPPHTTPPIDPNTPPINRSPSSARQTQTRPSTKPAPAPAATQKPKAADPYSQPFSTLNNAASPFQNNNDKKSSTEGR